jgi:hypothetical protein
MVFSIINFTFLDGFPFPEGGFVHLGLPNYFKLFQDRARRRQGIGTSGAIGARHPGQDKGVCLLPVWNYLISASIAHFSSGDARIGILFIIDPLVFLGLLFVSYAYFSRIKVASSHHGQTCARQPAAGAETSVAG